MPPATIAPEPAPNPDPAAGSAVPPGVFDMGLTAGMMGESVRTPRTPSLSPAVKANTLSLLKQNRIVGFHLTTIDQNGIAHGRDMYLLVSSVRTTWTVARSTSTARRPAASSAQSHRNPLAVTPSRTTKRKPLLKR